MKRSFITSIFALFLSLSLAFGDFQPGQGQDYHLRFDRLSIIDGLSQNTINTIIQDRRGFIWIATSDGLNRYDGYTFTIYRHIGADPNSLSDNGISALYEDSHGELWVGTGMGLDRYNPATNNFQHVSGLSITNVQALAEDHSGRLWIGTQSQGVWVLDLSSGELEHYFHNPEDPGSLASNTVYQILVSHSGDIWIATEDGLDHFEPSRVSFKHLRSNRSNPNSPVSSRVRSLFEDSRGLLWIGTAGGGLNCLDPRTGAFTFYLNSSQDPDSLGDNRVLGIIEDRTGVFWLATPSGLERFEPGMRSVTHYRHNPSDPDSLSASHVIALLEDRSGAIWIGTQGGGISLYRPAAHRFDLYQATPLQTGSLLVDGLQGNIVQAILEDHLGYLWLGSAEGTLSRLNRTAGSWTHFHQEVLGDSSLINSGVTSLAEDSSGKIWIGTYGGGLGAFDPVSGQFEHYRYVYGDPYSLSSNNIASLLVTQSGAIWVATHDFGLNYLDSSTGNFFHFRHDPSTPNSLSSDQLTALLEDHSGMIWIGTYDAGLSYYDPVSGSFHQFRADPSNPNSLNSDQILSLTEYPAGVLWIGTNKGLNRLDLVTKTILHYQVGSSLPSETMNCILADTEGVLWISTTNGLVNFGLSDNTFQTYTTADGLQSPEFLVGSCEISSDGMFFFGGVQGLNAFYPAQVVEHAPPPEVGITSIYKNNQVVPGDYSLGGSLQLTHEDETILFEYAAFKFNSVGRSRYKYRLEGFDEEWVEAGERHFVQYTNLPAGNYTFSVTAANDDGVWNEAGVSLHLKVSPAIWETAWFRVIVVLLVLGLLFGAYRIRLGAIKRRNLTLEQRVAELSQDVKAAAVAAERNRMARDLHDSVTQSIYSLVLLSEAGLRDMGSGEKAASAPAETRLLVARNTISRLSQIAQQALQEMRLMVYQLRPPAIDQDGLVGALNQRLESVERRAGMQARLIVEGVLSLHSQDEQELYSLAQEALNNALKHAVARSIAIRLSQKLDCFSLEISDDGHGFDPAQVPQGGFGLQSMRQRAENLGGTLTVISAPGEGTRIIFTRSMGDDTSCQKIFAS